MTGVSTSPGVPQPLATTDSPTFAGATLTAPLAVASGGTGLSVATRSFLAADEALPFPNDFDPHTIPNGVAVAAGTYYVRLRCVVLWDSGTDQIDITIASPTVSAGSVFSTAGALGASILFQENVLLSAANPTPLGTDGPVIVEIEGWVTFSGAGTISFLVNPLGGDVRVLKGASIEAIPF